MATDSPYDTPGQSSERSVSDVAWTEGDRSLVALIPVNVPHDGDPLQ